MGAGFGWVPIAGLRSHDNTPRLSEFRVEVKFKAKCIGLVIRGSVTVASQDLKGGLK